jgi:hypothetical protein
MMATFENVRHVSVSIELAPAVVYAFACKPQNLARWAGGLSSAIERVNGEWRADSPMGKVANGDGSEVIFSLFQRPEMSDEAFAADAAAVTRDLTTLKQLLERG